MASAVVGYLNTSNSASNSSTAQQGARAPKNNLDKDAFLNLLVIQLKNQNPLQPMEDKEFIAQMAQFTNLETTQSMNSTMRLNSAYNMVNKLVTAKYEDADTNSYKEVTGVVDKVSNENGKILLTVQDKQVLLDDVEEITDMVTPIDQMQLMSQSFGQLYAFSMIGKSIKAKVDSDDVTGVVERVKFSSGKAYAVVDGKDIPVSSIMEVSDSSTTSTTDTTDTTDTSETTDSSTAN